MIEIFQDVIIATAPLTKLARKKAKLTCMQDLTSTLQYKEHIFNSFKNLKNVSKFRHSLKISNRKTKTKKIVKK